MEFGAPAKGLGLIEGRFRVVPYKNYMHGCFHKLGVLLLVGVLLLGAPQLRVILGPRIFVNFFHIQGSDPKDPDPERRELNCKLQAKLMRSSAC